MINKPFGSLHDMRNFADRAKTGQMMGQTMGQMIRSVVFDLDGTLADTSGDLIAGANACFAALGHGRPLDPAVDQLVAFGGGRAMLRLGFERLGETWSEADVDRAFPLFLDYYRRDIDRHTTLYAGVTAALDTLSAAGVRLGVCTNKPTQLAEILLDRLAIRDRFAALLGADSLPVKKPDPAPLFETIDRLGGTPARSILIGDTITDRKTAQAANVPCVLIAFGPLGRSVAKMKPAALLEGYAALPDLVAQLIPA